MKQIFVSGAGRWLIAVWLCCVGGLSGATAAEPSSGPGVTDFVPAAPGPLSEDEALRFVMDLEQASGGAGANRADFELRDSDLAFVFEDAQPEDPLAAYQARLTKPGSGMRLAVDPRDEGLTLHWRISF